MDSSRKPPAPPEHQAEDLDETWVSYRRSHADPGGLQAADGTSPAMLVVIAHSDPRMLGRCFALKPGGSLVVGRSPECDISLPRVRELSRRQARFFFDAGQPTVEDLESKNGTLVNGRRIEGATRLRDDDRVEFDPVGLKFVQGDDVERAYHQAIYDLVMRDELTGVFNRRKYERDVERDFARAKRHDRPLSFVIFDIDELKAINDTYGHTAGDSVLRQLAALMGPGLRREEVFARVGGDEFLILCPEVGAEGATILAERLRVRAEGHTFVDGEQQIRITCSFGVAELDASMTSPEDLYTAADQALSRSKQEGRNRVYVAEMATEGD